MVLLPNPNQDQQPLFKKLRQNFKLPTSKIKELHINLLTANLKSLSIVQIQILDSTFFAQLYSRTKQLSHVQIQQTKLAKLVEILIAKIAFFTEAISLYRNCLDQYLKIRDKKAVSEHQILAKQQTRLIQYFLPFTTKFLEIYYQKSKKQPIKPSRSQIEQIKVNFDKQIPQFLREQIEKLMPINNESFRKHQSLKIARKQQNNIYFHQKIFIEKIMFKIREIDRKYNPFHKDNLKGPNYLASNLNKMKQDLQIQEFVPTKCINCVQFFYKEVPFHDEFNSLVDYQLVPSIQERDHILENITAFLNKGCGTLLFDCEPTPFGFVPVGYEMNLKEQQSIKYSFQNLLKYIKQESYQKSIELQIDFIPLKKNPAQSPGQIIMDPRQPYVQREYVNSVYVMRVRLKTKSERQFFGCQIDFKTYYYVRNRRKTKQVEGEDVYRENRKKAMRFYRFKTQKEIKNMQQEVGGQNMMCLIKGQREYRKNVHEGQCKQTLILSKSSNKKQTAIHHSSSSQRY